MKKNFFNISSFVFILIASIFISFHSVYAATPTLVNHTGKVNNNTTSAIDTTGANFLVVACHYLYTDTMTVSDNKGNSWYPLTSYGVNEVAGYVKIFYAYNAIVGTNHTFSCNSQTFIGITASAYSGVLSTSDPLDTSNGNTITGSNIIQTGGITPSQTGELVISAWSGGDSNESSVSVNSSFNNLDTIHDGSNMDGGMAYFVNSDTNTINPTWTIGSDSNLSATIASFKPAGTSTSFTLTGPTSGTVNAASTNFTVTPNGTYTGTITITPSGGGLSTPTVLTFSSSATPQTFTITPTSTGTVTLTPTNNGGLSNPSNLSYTVNTGATCAATTTGVWSTGSNWTGCTGAGGIPSATDNITINSGVTMTLDGNVTVASIIISGTLNTTATNYTITTNTITTNVGGIFDGFWSDIFLTGNTGTIITNNGSFHSDGTLKFSGNGDITLISGTTGNNSIASVSIIPTITANHTYTLGTGFSNVGGNFNIHPTGAFNLTVVPNNAIDVYHDFLVGGYSGATILMNTGSSTNYAIHAGESLVFDSGSTLTANASVITIGDLFQLDQQLRFGGTFNYGTSTVILKADLNQTNLLGDGAINFYNLTISPTLTASHTYTISRAFNVLNNFTINPTASSAANLTINLGGTTAITGALTVQGTGSATSILEAFQGTTNYTVTKGSLSVLTGGTYLPTYIATTFTLTGPTSGTVNAASSNFTITPSSFYTGTITITPSGGGLSTPIVKTFSNSYTPQTFTITPTSAGTVTLTPTNSGSLTNPGNGSYVASSGVGSCIATTTGVWSTGSNWTGCTGAGGIPSATDSITINNGVTMTLDTTVTVASIIVNGTLDTSASDYGLTTETITVGATGIFQGNHSTIVFTGSTGTIITNNGEFYSWNEIDFTGDGNITLFGGTNVNKALNHIDFKPALTANRVYTPGVNFTDSYGTLWFDATSSGNFNISITLTDHLNATGINMDPQGATATFNTGNYPVSLSNIYISPKGTFNAGSSTITLGQYSSDPGDRPLEIGSGGVFNAGTSTVVVIPDVSQTLFQVGGTYSLYNLTFAPTLTADRTYTINSPFSVTNNLTINPTASSAANLTINLGGTTAITGALTVQGTGSATSILEAFQGTTNYTVTKGSLSVLTGGTYLPTYIATTFTLTGPTSGTVNAASSNFTITPSSFYTGTITITPSGGGLSTPIVKTFSNSYTPQTFTITPTSAGTVTLTPTNSGSLTNPSNLSYTASSASATSFTLTGPTSGTVNAASTNFTVTPNGTYTGTITITPSGGGLSTPIVKTFSSSATPQTFTITPTSTGTVTLTPTNNGGLSNPSNLSYTVNTGATCAATTTGVWSTGSNWTGCTGAGGIPAASDNITINSGVTMTLDSNVTVGSIVVAGDLETTATNYTITTNTITTNVGGVFNGFWSDITLTGNTGTIITNNGTFNSDGTLIYTGNGDITLFSGATADNHISSVNLLPSLTANHTYTLGTGFSVLHGNFNIHPTTATTTFNLTVVPNNAIDVNHEMLLGGYNSTTISMSTGAGTNYPVTVGGSLVLDPGVTFDANASVITLGAKYPIDQQLRVGGTFNYGTSTVVLVSDSDQTNLLGDGAINFYNLTISPTLTASHTYTISRAFNVLNNFTINPTASSAANLTINLGGTTAITGALTVQGTGSATSILEAFQGTTNYTVTKGSLSVLTGGTYLPTYIATTFTLTGPTSGTVNAASSNFTITPSSFYTGTITITPSGGGLSTPIVKTFSNSYTPQTFTITPTSAGTVTLTPTNSGSLTNPGNGSYVASVATNHTYYIDPAGNDINDGITTSTPWQTLTKVNATSFLPGDQILFKKDGVWTGEIVAKTSGTNGNPITFGSYGTGTNKPIISGFSTLSGWTSLGGGIYESSCSNCGTTLNVVTLNGAQQAVGRYPNAGAANGGYLTYQSYTNTSITDSSLSGGSDWTGAQLVLRSSYWTLDVNPITSFSGSTINFTSATGGTPQTGFGYFIQNSPAALDQLGEWSYNSSTKKVQMYFGGNNPTSYTIKASTTPTLLNVDTKSYVTFDGLSFQGSNLAAMEVFTGNNTTIQNVDLSFSGVNGINIETSNNVTIQNSTITNSNNTAISVGTWGMSTGTVIKNNIITNTGSIPGLGKSGTGGYIAFNAYGNTNSNTTFEKNTVTNTGYNAIEFDGDGAIVKNNLVDNFCTILNDGAGIYTYNGGGVTHSTQRQVVDNIVINGSTNSTYGTGNPSYTASSGIYMDDNTDNVLMTGNTVANIPYAGIFLHNDKNITVTGNTVYNAAESVYIQTNNDLSHLIRGMNVSDNNFISTTTSQMAISAGSSTNGDTVTQYGTFDNNYYSRPLGLGKIFYGGTTNLTLAQWRSTYSEDANSHEVITPTGVAFNFLYNATASSSVKSFAGNTYTDVRGVSYTDSITLAPYASTVLTPSLTSATTFSLTGPSSGSVNTASSVFTITPNAPYTGTITITPSGGGLSTPIVKTFSSSATPQTFTITPTSTGTVTLTPTNNGGLSNPSNLSYTVNTGATCAATTTGVWSTGSNWTGCTGAGGIPAASDNITINSGVTMTLDSNVTVGSIVVAGDLETTATNYTISTGKITTNVGGVFNGFWSDITLTGNTGTIITNNGTFNSDGTLIYTGNGDITLFSGATADNHISSVNLLPSLTANHTYTLGTGFSVLHGNFNIHPTTATTTFNLTVVPNNAIDVNHEMLLGGYNSTTISMSTGAGTNYPVTVGGSLVLDPGVTFDANASVITLGAKYPIDQQLRVGGTFNYGTSTVVLVSDSDQTNLLGDGAINFYNLTISPTLTASHTYTISRAFNVLNNFTVNPTASSAANLTINLGGTTAITGALTVQGTGSATSILEAFQGTTNYTVTKGSLSVLTGGTYLPTYIATTFTLTGPTSGTVNAASSNFTITPSSFYTGTITITPSGGGLSTPIVKTFSNSYTPQTFTITPTSAGTVTLTPTNSGSLTNPSNLSYTASSASATSFTLTGPTSGTVNAASTNFTVTPNGTYTGTITITPSGGGLSTPIVKTFSSSATPQTFTITPTSTGTVTLTPTNNGGLSNPSNLSYTASSGVTTPTASSVSFTGTTTVNQTLTGTYTYADSGSHPEATSTFRWLRASTSNGTYSAISGATSSTYTLVSADIGNYIKFEVTPVSNVATGVAVLSSASAQINSSAVPTASAVSLSGTTSDGQTLTGTYTYNQADSVAQGSSTFRWLRASTSNGTYSAISGATSSTYTLVSADIGNYIKFEVTPVATVPPTTGIAVLSSASSQITASAVPTASSVSFTGTTTVNQTLTGTYTYADSGSHPEATSTFRWLRASTSNGTYSAISGATSSTYTLVSADIGNYIKFEVTPVSNVATGVAVLSSASAQIADVTVVSSGGGGGGGGSSMQSSIYDVTVSGITSTSALISWKTIYATDSSVDYGITLDYGLNKTDPTTNTVHSVSLSNLAPSTLYQFKIKSVYASNSLSFITLAKGVSDATTVPTVVKSPDGTTITPSVSITKTLKPGSNNSEVKQLQIVLQQLGFFPKETSLSNNFGPVTKQAVIKYQKSLGLTADGVVGPMTRKILNGGDVTTTVTKTPAAVTTPSTIVKPTTLPATLPATKTPTIVSTQKVAAPVTAPVVTTPVVTTPTVVNNVKQITIDLKYGDKNNQVKILQDKLKAQDFLDSSIPSNGTFGSVTRDAVKLLQQLYGLSQTGIVDSLTREKLNQ